jgi:hypothetical protein
MQFPEELKVIIDENGNQQIVNEEEKIIFGPFESDVPVSIWKNERLNQWCVTGTEPGYIIQGEKNAK